jgi:glucose/arabinose dehydrogenase
MRRTSVSIFLLALSTAALAGYFLLPRSAPAQAQRAAELVQEREGSSFVPPGVPATDERVSQLSLPRGFRIEKFAEGLGRPRIMAMGEDGTLYVTRPRSGDVLALRDENGDGRADGENAVVRNLRGVHGITLHDGKMYLATVSEVYVAEMRDGQVGEPKRIIEGMPPGGNHPNRTLGFGPEDGQLYITVGSTCNACMEKNEESATILRANPADWSRAIFAKGLRNTIGFGWHPQTKVMWGMDHGTDWLGHDFPLEELNRIEEGKNYGWPFVSNDRLVELAAYPEGFDGEAFLAQVVKPVLGYTAHSSPIQMVFYTGSQFPEEYRNDAFVAMHGSWNRQPASGYEVVRIDFNEQGDPVRFEPFLKGFLLDGEAYFGRPAGLAVGSDGSLFVGDDANGVVYRVSYNGGT